MEKKKSKKEFEMMEQVSNGIKQVVVIVFIIVWSVLSCSLWLEYIIDWDFIALLSFL